MKLKDLKITDDLQEQIMIGREFMDTYDEGMINFIKSQYEGVPLWMGYKNREEMMCKAAYDYWVYGFTPEQQFYFRLYEKNHEQKKEYLTVKTEFIYKARLNSSNSQEILEDKFEAYRLFKSYYKREMIKINGVEDYESFLEFISRHPKVILKPVGLSNTRGIEVVDSLLYENKEELFETFINVASNYKHDYMVNAGIYEGAVLEELIVNQEEQFGIFSPKSINVIRIPTIRLDDRIIPYGAYYKVGVSDDIVVGEAKEGIMCGIDCHTGIVNTDGITERGEEYVYHPISGIKFKGHQVPRWNEMIEMVSEIALKLPKNVNYAGWDVVLTSDKGWVLVEGNYWGQIFIQLVEKRGCAREFGDLIGWHMEEGKFWWQYKLKQVNKSAGIGE